MINQFKKIINLILILLISFCGFGQTEYLVKINPSSGAYTKIDSLPGVKLIIITPNYLTFDSNNSRYIFGGVDNNGNNYLYSADANTGNIILNPSFPVVSDPSDNVMELKYDNSTNTLYGLHLDNSENRRYFVSINPTNGVFTIIDSLPEVKTIVTGPHYTIFDEIHSRYIFRGGDNSGNYYLYSVDANTGSIISNPPFPVLSDPLDNVIALHYDNSSDKLYGLHWVNSESRNYLVSVNPTNGVFTIIDSLPGVKSIITNPHYTAFDEINHRYIFKGGDNNGIYHLYSIDVTTGNIISSPLFPVLADSLDNLIELQCDNSTGILYALHWEANTILTGVELSNKNIVILNQNVPNPFAENTTINYYLPDNVTRAQIIFLELSGKIIKTVDLTEKGKGQLNVFANDLTNGIYTYSLIVDGQVLETKKMIKAK